jgi:hypothetical protein
MQADSPDPKIVAEFKKRKLRQLLAAIPAIAAIVPLVMAENAGPDGVWGVPIKVLAPVCIVVVLAVLGFSLVNWRCPACKGYLGKKMSPRFCSRCGVQLQE